MSEFDPPWNQSDGHLGDVLLGITSSLFCLSEKEKLGNEL